MKIFKIKSKKQLLKCVADGDSVRDAGGSGGG